MTNTPTHTEIEAKYEVPADFKVPALHGVDGVATVARPVEFDLDATYFDTADLRLAHGGIALRRRSGGSDEGWHLKLARALDERLEVHRPLGRDPTRVPRALTDLVLARSRGRPLVPVATLRTRRIVRHLNGPGGAALAEVADDRVTGETGTGVAKWREVEVELLDGSRDLLVAVDGRLREAGAAPSASSSKLARLLDIGASTSGRADVGPGSTAGEVVLAHLAEQVSSLLALDPLVRVDAFDAVHKMRVAVRRLRSALATYRRLLDRSVTDPLRDELKWLGGVLGPVRDAEVIRDHLRDTLSAEPRALVIGPVTRRVDRTLGAEHRDAHRRALVALRGDRYLRLLGDLDQLAGGGALTGKRAGRSAAKALPKEVRRAYDRFVARVEQAGGATSPIDNDELLHEVRKSAKRVRYAAESARPALGSDAADLATDMEQLQEVLGAHQDSVVVRGLLRRLGLEAEADGDSAFTFGRLHALEEHRGQHTREEYDDLIGPIIDAPRKWLT